MFTIWGIASPKSRGPPNTYFRRLRNSLANLTVYTLQKETWYKAIMKRRWNLHRGAFTIEGIVASRPCCPKISPIMPVLSSHLTEPSMPCLLHFLYHLYTTFITIDRPTGLRLMSPVGWLPRNRNQLRAQRSYGTTWVFRSTCIDWLSDISFIWQGLTWFLQLMLFANMQCKTKTCGVP